jgi:4-hydroxy-tetrahydrodipicolinate reductase
MRLAIVGASGRMGRALVRLAHAEGIEVACAVAATEIGRDVGELAGVGPIGTAVVDGLAALEHARVDVIVDFSVPAITLALAPIAAATNSAIVSGTTGLSDEARQALARAADRVPVLWEPNMSVGVHVLSQLVAQAVTALADWDIEIVETHHRAKVDAPSGTALRLAEVAQRARAEALGLPSAESTRLVHGRQGKPGPRGTDEIGMHAIRGGDIIGDHAVQLFGGAERIELAHRATSRDVFAHGALRAARWIARKPAGTYALRDILGR